MPIRINLLAEAQAAEELRRKDPVKRALLGAVCLLLLVGLWASTLQFKIMAAKGDLNALDTKWRAIEADYKTAVENRRAITETEEKLVALQAMRTNRFLWGTALNAMQQTLNGVDDVQVLHLRGEQTYLQLDGTPARTNGTQVVPARPPGANERIVLTIDGLDTAAGHRINKFKESISAVPFFKETLARTNAVLLTSRGAPQGGRVNFTLQCYFQEKIR